MFRNRHFHLAPPAFFTLATSFLLGPLSANIFQAHTPLVDSSVPIQILSSFNASLYGVSVLANALSFGTAIQRADAPINQDATFPTWTIVNATFPQLAIDYTNSASF